MFYRKWNIKNTVVLDVRSVTHLEAFWIKQGVLFLHIYVLGVWRGVHMQLHTSYAKAWYYVNNKQQFNIIGAYSFLSKYFSFILFSFPSIFLSIIEILLTVFFFQFYYWFSLATIPYFDPCVKKIGSFFKKYKFHR